MIRHHPLVTACSILELSSQGDVPELTQRLIDHWDRRRFQGWPLLAKAVLCQIACYKFADPVQQEKFLAWACQEAENWWPGLFNGQPVTQRALVQLHEQLFRGGS